MGTTPWSWAAGFQPLPAYFGTMPPPSPARLAAEGDGGQPDCSISRRYGAARGSAQGAPSRRSRKQCPRAVSARVPAQIARLRLDNMGVCSGEPLHQNFLGVQCQIRRYERLRCCRIPWTPQAQMRYSIAVAALPPCDRRDPEHAGALAAAERTPLSGGVDNPGAVVKQGDEVLRPARPTTDTAHRLLRHVRARGFLGVPEPRGNAEGIERLLYIPGDVPIPPFPDWWKATLP